MLTVDCRKSRASNIRILETDEPPSASMRDDMYALVATTADVESRRPRCRSLIGQFGAATPVHIAYPRLPPSQIHLLRRKYAEPGARHHPIDWYLPDVITRRDRATHAAVSRVLVRAIITQTAIPSLIAKNLSVSSASRRAESL
jgi:hypothetical protein